MGLKGKNDRITAVLISTFFLLILISSFTTTSSAGMSAPGINENKGLGLSGPVVQNSQFTGAAVVGVPVLVPPGRNGVAPKLSLTYNSFQKNNWMGVGWNLDMGAIQRSTKFGVCYDCDDYVANINGSSSELVPRADWGPDYYGAKIEGAFSKYYEDSYGGWIVYSKDGTKYYFGTTDASRQVNEHGVFKWCLDKIEDTNGNYLEVTYSKDQGQIYLDEIHYTGHSSLAPSNYVKFYLMDREAQDAPPMYDTNSRVITAKLLRSIDIQANGDRVRAYQFNYSINLNSHRSVLTSVQQFGTDAELEPDGYVTGGTTLPSTDLTWFAGGDGSYTYESSIGSSGNHVLFADVDGDGKADLIKYTSNGWVYTYLSNGDGTYENHTTTGGPGGNGAGYVLFADVSGDGKADLIKYTSDGWVYTFISKGDGTYKKYKRTGGSGGNGAGYVNLADVNGDGKADLIKHNGSGWVYTFLSNGDGTYQRRKKFGGSGGNGAGRVMFADVNGDGNADLIKLGKGGWVYTYLSDGDGAYTYGSTTGGNGNSAPGYVHFADVNGDGRTDMAKHENDGMVFTFLSKGDGTFTSQKQMGGGGGNGNGYIGFADVNGDGRADLIKRTSDGWVYTYISDGSGFYIYHSTTGGAGGNGPNLVQCADVDGNGRADLIKLATNGMVYTFLSNGDGPADYLQTATSPFGAVTTLSYTPSSQYQNQLLPFIIQALSSLEGDDGFGNLSTTHYSYANGLFDFETREFRGFETVIQTSATGTPHEVMSVTKFFQDKWFKGRQAWTGLWEPGADPQQDTPLTKTTFLWSTEPEDPPEGSHGFVKLDQKVTESFDDVTVTVEEDYTYDTANGNLLSKTTSGTDGEDVTISYQYSNLGDWMWRKTRETGTGSVSGQVRESYFGYESATGNLISQEFWLDGGVNPRIEMTYDQYGNQIAATDARGNTTTTEYDTLTNTFPIKIINPETNGISHIAENEAWDYRFGKVSIAKDENGNRTYYNYDEFGRPVQVDSPNGGQVITEYYDDEFPRYVVTKVKEDASGNTIDAYQYVDGLGREIQTITFGEGGKSIVFKKFYDALGRNDLNEGPFFATGVGYPLNPSDAYPWQQTTSDLRGRPEAIESADGEYGSVVATFSYSGLSTTIIDPDGGSKTEQKDYLGRVIQVIEHADGANYTTTYSYNAAGDLLTVNDHYNNTTTINYDTLGRKISMNDPDMGYWEYAYDANGNLLTQLDEKLQTIEFKYDELNRVTSKTYSTSDPAVNYAYDNLTIPNGRGQLYTVSNTQVTTTYDAYDVMGNVTSVSKTIIGDDTVYTTQYEYDLIGRLLKTIYPDGYEATQHYYSGSGLLEAVRDPQARLLAHMSNYTPGGKVGRIEYRNTVITEYAYDPESTRLLSIVTNGPPIVSNHSVNALVGIGNPGQSTSTVGMPAMGTAGTGQSSPMAGVPAPATNPYYQSKSYKYTPSGNIKEIIDNVEGVSFYYTYDKLHRLKAETNTGSYNPISYTYNAIGNITSKTVGTGTFHYTYDDWHKHAVKTINLNGFDFQYEYDDNGNMTSGPDFSDPLQVATRTISYNADNMPTSISHVKGTTTVTTNYTYDGDGVRSKKSILGGSTTYYIGGHFEIKDGVSTKYIFAGNLRIAKVDASGTHYFHKDHLGSSTVMTDAAGAVVETTDYMPFGSQRNRTGADVSVYKFTDQEFDSESGLYNYNARLYDPKLGIFITPDSIVPDFSDPQSLNRYSYCRNNPLIYADPSGHNPFIVGAIVGAAVGTLSAGAQSNWDAGAMLQGAALGAITGAISAGSFFAAGEIIQAGILTCPITGIEVQTLTAVEQALIHAAAGAFSGGINSGIAGGDIGLGMLTGAASAGIGKFAGGYLPSNRMWQYGGRAAIAGGVGGVAHSISGGNFWTGAAWGAGTAAFGYTFNELWHELYPDWGVHPNIRSISAGGKAPGIGTDTHYDAYTRGKGTMTLEKSQSLTANIVAVGATTTFDRLSWFQADKSLPNIQTDIGLGNYLGFSFNRHQGTIMVNIGVAANLFNMMGSPVAISVPLNP